MKKRDANDLPTMLATLRRLLGLGFKQETYHFTKHMFIDKDVQNVNLALQALIAEPDLEHARGLLAALDNSKQNNRHFSYSRAEKLINKICVKSQRKGV